VNALHHRATGRRHVEGVDVDAGEERRLALLNALRHGVWANSKAYGAVGVTRDSVPPEGSSAAQQLQLDEEVGSLTAGRLADFVVLDRNPLASLAVVQTLV